MSSSSNSPTRSSSTTPTTSNGFGSSPSKRTRRPIGSRLPKSFLASSLLMTTAILNTGNSFDLKTIEGGQMAMEGLHGFKNKDIEKVSYRSPEFYLCA